MTHKYIHLRILSEYKVALQNFIESGAFNKYVKYNNDFVEVNIYIDKNKEETTKIRIASKITNTIIFLIKKELIKENIKKFYKITFDEDIENIYENSLKYFCRKETFVKDYIFNTVYEYISTNNHINIDGFVKFRINGCLNDIHKAIVKGIEEYLLKKNKDEFTNTLMYFVEAQEEKIDLLKVYMLKDGSFILCDKDYNILENKNDEDMINMIMKENLDYEDFLISTLLTWCPKQMIIYDRLRNDTSKQTIETIKSIFDYRVFN